MELLNEIISFCKRKSVLAVITAAFLLLVLNQCKNLEETICWNDGSGPISSAISVGQAMTVSWRPKLVKVTINNKDSRSLTTTDGTNIPYDTIVMIRKGDDPSNPSIEWDASDSIDLMAKFDRLQKMFAVGDVIFVEVKPPSYFKAVIQSKNDQSFTTADGKIVRYEDVGCVTRKTPLYEAFPKKLATDLLAIPAMLIFGLLWIFTDFIAVLGHH